MKRYLSIVCVFIITVLASCSTQSSGTMNEESSKKKVTLRYAMWDVNQLPAMEEIAGEFMESHPNINVVVESVPFDQYWTKLETSATGGSAPDLFWMNVIYFLEYSRNGIIMPLDDSVEKDDFNLDHYPQQLVDMYIDEEKLYALPKDLDTVGLWYNKKIFDEAGIEYPDDSWDWDKLIEVSQELTDPEKGIWGIAAKLDTRTGYYNTIPQAEGYVLENNTSGYGDPNTIAGLKLWTDLIHVHKASPSLVQMTDTDPLSLFKSGKVAMTLEGSWSAIELANDEYTSESVDVAVLPKGKKRSSSMNGLGNVIYSETEHPEEAWEFLKFLASEEAAKIQSKTGTVIPAFDGTQEEWVNSIPQFNLNAFIEMIPYGEIQPYSLETNKWRTVETDHFTKAWTGEVSIEEAAKNVAEEMDELIEQEGN